MDRYGVVGHPVAHSLSPVLHAHFAAAAGIDLEYRQLDAPPAEFAAAVRRFAEAGGRGLNVTLPHKAAALELAGAASTRARRAGAANWLAFGADGAVRADNTDGAGLLRDLKALGLDPAGQHVLVLGAGGAARGILGELLDAGPARLLLANRTIARARELAARFPGVDACGLEELGAEAFDLLVNATAAGRTGAALELPDSLLDADAACYDLGYGGDAGFLRWAQAAGCARAHDGLGMLVEQAAESFALWHGVRPDAAAARRMLRP